MLKKALIAFAVLAMLAGVALWRISASMSGQDEAVAVPDPLTLREITQGRVIGFLDAAGTYSWRGIPYARAPVAELRWRAPQPAPGWSETRQATRFGSMCPQIGSFVNKAERRDYGKVIGSEDCLTLNVWTPRFGQAGIPKDESRLPVMVWIHGGANVIGASSLYPFIRNMAGERNLVVVSVNYRLGVLGWFHHPALDSDASNLEDRSGNYGTLDIIRALHWVQENISAFGGNPGRVTLVGESAGGFDVYSMLLSPLARGLFQGAISESGSPRTLPLSDTENYRDESQPGHERSAREIMNELLIRDGKANTRAQAKLLQERMAPEEIRHYLRSKSVADLLATVAEPNKKMLVTPAIFRDGAVIPKDDPDQLFSDPANYNGVPFIAGTNRDEMRVFNLMDPDLAQMRLGVFPSIKDEQTFDRLSRYGSDNWISAGTNEPLMTMSASGRRNVFGYRFDWHELPNIHVVDFGKVFGATHGMEVNFVFNVLDNNGMVGTFYDKSSLPGRIALAHAMSSYWAEFAYNGAPGRGREGDLPEWTAWSSAGNKYMIFDSVGNGGLRMDPHAGTKQSLQERLLQDRAHGFISGQDELCRTFAQLFVYSRVRSYPDSLEKYEKFGPKGCSAYPPEQFRTRMVY